MATIHSLPAEILRMVLANLDTIGTLKPNHSKMITDVLKIEPSLANPHIKISRLAKYDTCEWTKASFNDKFDLSAYSAMRVCHVWHKIILETCFQNSGEVLLEVECKLSGIILGKKMARERRA
ncbi:hypothetical protein PMZ80_005550 [Knufia obscura]|uniref:F-box domain-containing protein n=2 Tax=Knufia TaxID=430999 RepID=A0AAN8E9U1_9EURO|nr:hypothetical protein PMZ80_005550 [Knufia obscura]KAK5950019.1 hypothetical protein OHC33_008980 [Knufia fluminis]